MRVIVSLRKYGFRLVLGIFAVTCMCLSLITVEASGPATPDLPKALVNSKAHPNVTLLNFYAEWCGTCQWMEPQVKRIEKAFGSKLQVIYLNVDLPQNEPYIRQYHVTGTPTYVVFDRQKKPRFRMDQYVSPQALTTHLLRVSGDLKKHPLPETVRTHILRLNVMKPLVLLAFEPENCSSCEQNTQVIQASARKYTSMLSPVYVKSGASGVNQYLKALSISKRPAYVLVDTQGHVLFQVEGPLQADTFGSHMDIHAGGLKAVIPE